MKLILYKDKILEETHIALVKGEIQKDKETIVRVHEPLSVIDLLDIEDKKHSWNAKKNIHGKKTFLMKFKKIKM